MQNPFPDGKGSCYKWTERGIVPMMTRKELYDGVWISTVRGFAEEQDLNYARLLQILKEQDIPKPDRRALFRIRQGEDGRQMNHRPALEGDPDAPVRLPHRRPPKAIEAGTGHDMSARLAPDLSSLGRDRDVSYSLELARTEDLIRKARDYEDAASIRRLIKGVRKRLETGDLEHPERFAEWAAWASEKAAWLDPAEARCDELLGRRHDPILAPKEKRPRERS